MSDEYDIINYLESQHGQFVSAKEVSRRAGGKGRFAEEGNWARPVLRRLVGRGICETDSTGSFRLKPVEPTSEQSLASMELPAAEPETPPETH